MNRLHGQPGLQLVIDGLDVVAVGVQHERAVVARRVLRVDARPAVVPATGGDRCVVEGVVLLARVGSSERLLVFFARRLYNAQLTLDSVGETFARAYGGKDRSQGADPAPWLWRVARNVLHDAYRRGRGERRALRRLSAHRIELSEDESRRIAELSGDDLDVRVARLFWTP